MSNHDAELIGLLIAISGIEATGGEPSRRPTKGKDAWKRSSRKSGVRRDTQPYRRIRSKMAEPRSVPTFRRCVIAKLSVAGHKAAVKSLIAKFGANKLSDIAPEQAAL